MDIHRISARQTRDARAAKADAARHEAPPPKYWAADAEEWAEHVVMTDRDRVAEMIERLSDNDNAVELIYELMNGPPRRDRNESLARWAAMLICELRDVAETIAREDLETL